MPHNLPNLSNNKFRIVVSAVLFAVAVLLLTILVVLPMTTRVRETRAKILENQGIIDAQTKQVAEFQAAEKKLVQIRSSLREVLDLFPVREDAVVLVEALESAVDRSRVAGVQLRITDVKEAEIVGRRGAAEAPAQVRSGMLKNIEEVPFNVKLHGRYRNFADLMIYLENSPFIIEIRDIDFRAEISQTETGFSKTGFADGALNGLFFLNTK